MISKVRKINPLVFRIGFVFFWNKSLNSIKNKYSLFLKYIYLLTYFFTIIFEKFFKFQIYKLRIFFKINIILFNFTLLSFKSIFYSLFNLYFPKLYDNNLSYVIYTKIKKKKFHRFNPYLSFNSYAQAFNLFEDKLTNTKFINFFLEEFFFLFLKKKYLCI